jgi:hypothetical protein
MYRYTSEQKICAVCRKVGAEKDRRTSRLRGKVKRVKYVNIRAQGCRALDWLQGKLTLTFNVNSSLNSIIIAIERIAHANAALL